MLSTTRLRDYRTVRGFRTGMANCAAKIFNNNNHKNNSS